MSIFGIEKALKEYYTCAKRGPEVRANEQRQLKEIEEISRIKERINQVIGNYCPIPLVPYFKRGTYQNNLAKLIYHLKIDLKNDPQIISVLQNEDLRKTPSKVFSIEGLWKDLEAEIETNFQGTAEKEKNLFSYGRKNNLTKAEKLEHLKHKLFLTAKKLRKEFEEIENPAKLKND